MNTYHNTKTGAVIHTDCEISGKDWKLERKKTEAKETKKGKK